MHGLWLRRRDRCDFTSEFFFFSFCLLLFAAHYETVLFLFKAPPPFFFYSPEVSLGPFLLLSVVLFSSIGLASADGVLLVWRAQPTRERGEPREGGREGVRRCEGDPERWVGTICFVQAHLPSLKHASAEEERSYKMFARAHRGR